MYKETETQQAMALLESVLIVNRNANDLLRALYF